MITQKSKLINRNPWVESWNRHGEKYDNTLVFFSGGLDVTLNLKKRVLGIKKWQNTSACFSNHKQTNSGWNPNRGSAGLVQRNNGYTKDQAVKTTGHEQKRIIRHARIRYTHAHTYHSATTTITTTKYGQNPRPNQRQGGRAAQDKTPLADCLLLSRPFLQKTLVPLNPSPPFPPNPGHLGRSLSKFRAQLLAWPDLRSCTDALYAVEEP